MQTDLIAHLTLAAPEVLLAVGALALLMIGVFSGERATTLVNGLSVAMTIAAMTLCVHFPTKGAACSGAIVISSFSRFMKVLTLISCIVTLFMSVSFAQAEKFDKFEFPVLIVISTLG